MNNMKKKLTGIDYALINFVFIAALGVVILPLLYLGKFVFATADDWSYGIYCYQAIVNGKGLAGIIAGVCKIVNEAYLGWDGRFGTNTFLAIQPGIFGEHCYAIVPYLMIGMLIFSELVLADTFLTCGNKRNRLLIVPFVFPWLALQILFVPYPVETFFWYSGSFSYTFINGLALISYSMFYKLAHNKYGKSARIIKSVIMALLLIIVGGGNYTTQIYIFTLLFVHSLMFFVFDRSKFQKIWFALPVLIISMVVCFAAPGRTKTLNTNYSGGVMGFGFIESVFQSLYRTFTNIYSWTNKYVLIIILLTLPFIIILVDNTDHKFRLPALFSVVSYGIYASMLTPTLYAQGNNGGGRTGDILWYMYNVWLVTNIYYWTGWIKKRLLRDKKISFVRNRFLYVYCALVGGLLLTIVLKNRYSTTSYEAYESLVHGEAQCYASEWEERFEVLHDKSIQSAEFDKLTYAPDLFCYVDLQTEDGYTWVNSACAQYYGKESIVVRTP